MGWLSRLGAKLIHLPLYALIMVPLHLLLGVVIGCLFDYEVAFATVAQLFTDKPILGVAICLYLNFCFKHMDAVVSPRGFAYLGYHLVHASSLAPLSEDEIKSYYRRRMLKLAALVAVRDVSDRVGGWESGNVVVVVLLTISCILSPIPFGILLDKYWRAPYEMFEGVIYVKNRCRCKCRDFH